MPSSPQTRRGRRRSSVKSTDPYPMPASVQSNCASSRRTSFSQRSSQHSTITPKTPRSLSSYDRYDDYSRLNGFADVQGIGREEDNGNGIGNLADELAEAWDEGGEGEDGEEVSQLHTDEPLENEIFIVKDYTDLTCNDNVIKILRPPAIGSACNISLSPPNSSQWTNHRRQHSQYDGSDYGDDCDLETAEGISRSLEARMAAIENLARKGTEANDSVADSVVQRVADSLKNLPSQSGVENGTSRLITANTAITSNLTTQLRTLTALTCPLLSPLAIPPEPEIIEEAIPLLATLLVSLPTPTANCFSSLHSLRNSTTDLHSTLTYLSDTIYMTRQTITSGSRKLRLASEMVVGLRREAEAAQEAVRWIEKGDWDQRLAARECAKVCRDVVGGFEEVCDIWRRRLVGEIGAV